MILPHARLSFFSVLLLLPTFFYLPFTLLSLYFNAFHFLPLSFHVRYFHVLPLSVHILSLSLHAMSKISQIEIFGMHDRGHHGGHNLYVWILEKSNTHTYKNISFRVRAISLSFLVTFLSCVFILLSVSFHFLPCSFHFRQSYLCFAFILFYFPPFLLFFHVLLMFLWFPFPFVSFSFSSSFHVPFILLSCHFSFLPFFLQVIPFSLYVLSLFKIISNFRACSFQIMFIVLGSFHDLQCPFLLLFNSLFPLRFACSVLSVVTDHAEITWVGWSTCWRWCSGRTSGNWGPISHEGNMFLLLTWTHMQHNILTCRRLFITDCKINNTRLGRLGSLGLNRWLLPMAGKFASRITCPMAGASTSGAFGTSF